MQGLGWVCAFGASAAAAIHLGGVGTTGTSIPRGCLLHPLMGCQGVLGPQGLLGQEQQEPDYLGFNSCSASELGDLGQLPSRKRGRGQFQFLPGMLPENRH